MLIVFMNEIKMLVFINNMTQSLQSGAQIIFLYIFALFVSILLSLISTALSLLYLFPSCCLSYQ